MVDTRKLELERHKRARKEEIKEGIREGTYKITEGATVRWFRVEVTFYPTVKWWIEEVTGVMDEKPVKGTRRELDKATKRRLETWL